LETQEDINERLPEILNTNGFALIEVICPFSQNMSPSSSAKINSDGKLVSQPLENMYPFLDDEEFKQEMIINPL
jgi:acetolactate synthase-1/2/3 large subunit